VFKLRLERALGVSRVLHRDAEGVVKQEPSKPQAVGVEDEFRVLRALPVAQIAEIRDESVIPEDAL
jgi:hypothetical protein